jgi:hypothetical protein
MRILVCPLDWGLGHAARCIPLIRVLRSLGHEVRIGAAGGGLRLLRAEFPDLEAFEFPGYAVRYARSAAAFLPVMLAQAPRILAGLRAEARLLRRLLAERPCDLVISDGRYGLRAAGAPTIFITHQIRLRVPGRFPGRALAEAVLLRLNLATLRRFARVWIPDAPGAGSLAGALASDADRLANAEWIGPLGRFAAGATEAPQGPRVDIAAVISGPEPQRSLFEARLRRDLAALKGTRVLVRGLPGTVGPALSAIREGALNEFDHLPGPDLARLFARAGAIIARSGYTTVMELATLGARAAVLVPTPGQSEQEYLARHLERCGAAVRREQEDLELGSALAEAERMEGFARWREADPEARLREFLANHPLLRPMGAAVGKAVEQ